MHSRPGRVVIITGDPSLPDPTKLGRRYGPADLAVHEAMRDAFESLGQYEYAVIDTHAGLYDAIREFAPELVVNFCDTGLYNNPEFEIHVVTELEVLGIPYTGATPRGMLVCYDKQIVHLVAEAMGIDVPAERFVPAAAVRDASVPALPALIKPNTADGSVGITRDAVVRTAEEARQYLAWLADELPGRDVLIQEYLPGGEYGLALIGNPDTGFEQLPMLEVDFSKLPDDCSPILSFESKTDPDSPYWTDIGVVPASLTEERQRELGRLCQSLFQRLGLRDYGRFDFRTGADGRIKLMEVNPNPAWGFDAKLALMAGFAGLSYAELLDRLVATAWSRVRRGTASR